MTKWGIIEVYNIRHRIVNKGGNKYVYKEIYIWNLNAF